MSDLVFALIGVGALLAGILRGRVVFVSVVLHGIAATPVMRLLDHFNERTQPSPSVTETP